MMFAFQYLICLVFDAMLWLEKPEPLRPTPIEPPRSHVARKPRYVAPDGCTVSWRAKC